MTPETPHAFARRMMKFACVASLFASVSTLEAPCLAFDYPEHASLTWAAIRSALAEENQADPAAAGTAIRLFVLFPEVLHSTMLCRGNELFADNPTGCFGLGDISALSGDHAASPLMVKWRWLSDRATPSAPRSNIERVPALLSGFDLNATSPDTTSATVPSVSAFLEYMRRATAGHVPPDDTTLQSFDDEYATLAERGHPHFRPALARPTASTASARAPGSLGPTGDRESYYTEPAREAFAWYADLHLGALTFAEKSRVARTAEERDRYGVEALYLELTSLHYLEDSVSSGHMVAEAADVNDTTLQMTHDHYCAEGIPASLREPQNPICDALKSWRDHGAFQTLLQACGAEYPMVRIYGDHVLARRGRDARATTEWATFVAATSLVEVMHVFGNKDLTVYPIDLPVPRPRQLARWLGPHGVRYDDSQIYEDLVSWWERIGLAGTVHGSSASHLIVSPFYPQSFRALTMVPTPYLGETGAALIQYPLRSTFAGAALDTSAAFGWYGNAPDGKGRERVELSVGPAVAIAPTQIPLILGAQIHLSMPLASDSRVFEAIMLQIEARYLFSAQSHFGIVGVGHGGILYGAGASPLQGIGGGAGGLSWLPFNKNRSLGGLDVLAGGDGTLGYHVGARIVVLAGL